jgi:hypothetical protein
MLGLVSCKNKTEGDLSDKNSKDSTLSGLENQKQNLEQQENQLKIETETLKRQKAKNDSILKAAGNISLISLWSGSINKDTPFDLQVIDFDGTTFKGKDQIYSSDKSTAVKTFTVIGTYNPKTREIVINEDKEAKGSGKFTGKLDAEGKFMSGKWEMFSEKKSYNWELNKVVIEKAKE